MALKCVIDGKMHCSFPSTGLSVYGRWNFVCLAELLNLQISYATGWYSTEHTFLYQRFEVSCTFPTVQTDDMSWSKNSTRIFTFLAVQTGHMFTNPHSKTPPRAVNLLQSRQVTCSHFPIPKLHPYHCISYSLDSSRFLIPKLHPDHYISYSPCSCFLIPKCHPVHYIFNSSEATCSHVLVTKPIT